MTHTFDEPARSVKRVICVALYSFDVGGSEMIGATLARHYLDSGFEVVCVATRRMRGPLQERIEAWGVECLAMGLDLQGRLARPFKRRRLASWLKERNVSVLHAHHFAVFADVLDAANAAGVKRTIVTEHSAHSVIRTRRYRRGFRRLARQATVCTAINTFVQEALAEVCGLPASNVLVIENGVDTNLFVPAEDPATTDSVTIGWVGRLHPDKDVLNGLRAFEMVALRSRDRLRLLVAGDGEEMEVAREFVETAEIGGCVEFLGLVSDVVGVLHRCDAFLLSSRTEGMPLALLEAMSCGLPVVATSVGAIPASVTRDAAKLVPPEDPEALAEAILTVVEQRELRREMGRAARDLVLRRFSDRVMKDRYADLLRG